MKFCKIIQIKKFCVKNFYLQIFTWYKRLQPKFFQLYRSIQQTVIILLRHIHVLTNHSSSFFGLDITDDSVKIITLAKQDGNYIISAYAEVKLPKGVVVNNQIYDIQLVSQAINQAHRKANIQTQEAAIALPAEKMMSKLLQVDANLTKKELQQYINFIVDKQISYPLSDLYVDYVLVAKEKDQSKRQHILLVAVLKKYIRPYIQIFAKTNLRLNIIDVQPLVVANMFEVLNKNIKNN
ncbi:MAG: pilus assembly protein PilM, partial [Pseudomonadota bacterium]